MASRLQLALALLPKLPLVVRVAVLHILGLSESSKYLDLQSDLTVAIIRSFLEYSKQRSISQVQKISLGSQEVKGRIWISLYCSPPPPETSIRDALVEVIDDMSRSTRASLSNVAAVRVPELAHVEAEWTGYRAAASPSQGPPAISEAEKYREMMKECKQPATTVLYFHGGAYYLMDPATHRTTTKRLAKMLGARCYSVRYRLAPKYPFPSALLDALVSYFTLLYPPPDAYHEAVKPEHLIISGDSAGGSLSLALLQVLLHLRRQDKPIYWYGERRQVPLPAGVLTVSPWADVTQSGPAWHGEGPPTFDYLVKPRPGALKAAPPCDIWPTDPPRENLYADDDLMAHPLVSVIMAGSWKGSPPIYMCTGWEFLSWEDKALARKIAADGVPLVYEEYEAMCHCFALILKRSPSTRHCFESCTSFIQRAIHYPASIEPSATLVKARTLEELPLRFEDILEESHDSVLARVAAKARSFSHQPEPNRESASPEMRERLN